jgi:hypothetical protein
LSGPDTLLEQQQPNETKELMSLSQIKNVVHSRSASTPNTCWSPTMSNNLWSHRPFHNNEVSSKPLYRVTHVPCYWLNFSFLVWTEYQQYCWPYQASKAFLFHCQYI